ncbi:MAG: sulfate ABC transporter permease subunit CysT, partial [Alcaligenes aquatilis]
ITPLLIVIKLEQFDYAGASALAVLMMVLSFLILLAINRLQWYLQSRHSGQTSAKAAKVPAPLSLEGAR